MKEIYFTKGIQYKWKEIDKFTNRDHSIMVDDYGPYVCGRNFLSFDYKEVIYSFVLIGTAGQSIYECIYSE